MDRGGRGTEQTIEGGMEERKGEREGKGGKEGRRLEAS